MEERDSRARSIKTRIETGEAHQGKNSLVLFESKINSSVQFMLIVRQIREQDPLKQGLKQEKLTRAKTP